MKTIILAAWKWTKLMPLTKDKPKPMVEINNKPILEYILESIEEFTTDIIIITKYKEEQIKNYFKNKWHNINITYKTQWNEKWTWSALWWLNINKDLIVLNGDTIYDKKDLEKLYKLDWYGCLVKEVSEPEKYWIFYENTDHTAKQIIEKPQEFIGNLANIWIYKFPNTFIKIVENIQLSPRWEYELSDNINKFLKTTKFQLIKQEWEFIDIGYPQNIEKAIKHL